MTENHPITPPPELVREWMREANHNESMFPQVAAMAAQWGADQELEAWCEWLESRGLRTAAQDIRAARRPKPPSLKEQALKELAWVDKNLKGANFFGRCDAVHTIRRALEQLDD
jgi:hypothetical protein